MPNKDDDEKLPDKVLNGITHKIDYIAKYGMDYLSGNETTFVLKLIYELDQYDTISSHDSIRLTDIYRRIEWRVG